jgi:geranylgeranyl pyrophosphate synthase
LLSDKAGCGGMVAGQVMDIEAETTPVNGLTALTTIHRYKTGALIQASILAGAIIGEADEEEYGKLASFGNDIGLAFQIIDDVLDVSSGEKKRGSKTSSDIANGKTTYVSLLGVDKARRQAAELLDRAVATISGTRTDYTLLKELAVLLVNRES